MIPAKKVFVIIIFSLAIFGVSSFSISYYYKYLIRRIALASEQKTQKQPSRLESLTKVNLPIILYADDRSISLPAETINSWMESYTRSYTNTRQYRFNENAVKKFLNNYSKEIYVGPSSAVLGFKNAAIYEESPGQPGLDLDVEKTSRDLETAIINAEPSVRLSYAEIAPEITAEKISRLGIDLMIGSGESDFSGSPHSRIKNIKVASTVFNNLVLAAGQEFSFNSQLGQVDDSTGYEPELVIKGSKLIKEYGGGICQISTTLFRAIAASGLVILERHPHSLPVRYYNPQGFDATVYPGSADLRFKNDTSSNILVQSKVSGNKISFNIFGRDDSRKVSIDGPHVYEVNKDGSMKAYLKRNIVFSDGQKKRETFYSSYKSPALFETIRNPLE